MNAERWRQFRKSSEWRYLEQFLKDRIEGNRDLLETPEDGLERAGESNEFIRGRNAEIRLIIAAVQSDQLLLADIQSQAEAEAMTAENS